MHDQIEQCILTPTLQQRSTPASQRHLLLMLPYVTQSVTWGPYQTVAAAMHALSSVHAWALATPLCNTQKMVRTMPSLEIRATMQFCQRQLLNVHSGSDTLLYILNSHAFSICKQACTPVPARFNSVSISSFLLRRLPVANTCLLWPASQRCTHSQSSSVQTQP